MGREGNRVRRGRFGLAGSQALSIFLEPRDNGIFRFIPVLEQWEQKPGRKQRKDLERSS